MNKSIFWRFLFIGIAVVIAVVFFLPNTPWFKNMPEWWQKNMPNKGIVLGLDLQGGLHLVFEVEADKAVDSTVDRYAFTIREMLQKKNLQAEVKKNGLNIEVNPAGQDVLTAIKEGYNNLDVSMSGQTAVLTLNEKERTFIKDNAANQALETIRNRIDQFGVSEPTIHRQGANEIVVQLPGVKDPKRAIDLIGKTALLEFKLVDDESPIAAQLPSSIAPGDEEKVLADFGGRIPEGSQILFEKKVNRETGAVTKFPILLKKETVLTGALLSEARVALDTQFSTPHVSITFNPEGAKRFEEITAANVKKRLAIILDNTVYSAPVIQERISGGQAQITGSFTMEEATDLAIVLRAGALPAPVNILEERTVGPSLGQDSIDKGTWASIIAGILILIFMVIYYRLTGLCADVALAMNMLLLLGVMVAFKATLTLPGIAGIVLTLGMAVDANVLINERIREELRLGKTPRAAVEAGYAKAFLTIFDSNVTTLVAALFLFGFGTGPVKGFAVTLTIGIVVSMFTAIVVTRIILDYFIWNRKIQKISI